MDKPHVAAQVAKRLLAAEMAIDVAHAALETLGQRLSPPASAFGAPIKPSRATAD